MDSLHSQSAKDPAVGNTMVAYVPKPSRAAVNTDDTDARIIVAVSFRNVASHGSQGQECPQ